jgi:glutamate/aspartate transport system substrate-binding protein
MRSAIEVVAAAFLLAGIFAPAKAQDLEGTLKKVKENSTFTIGHRDSSIPLSYLDDKLLPVGFSIELCKHVAEAVKAKLGMPSLKVVYNPVTSATRIPLVANGTVDIECGSTANMTSRQRQVGFSYTFFVPQFKWITRARGGINSADDLRGNRTARADFRRRTATPRRLSYVPPRICRTRCRVRPTASPIALRVAPVFRAFAIA